MNLPSCNSVFILTNSLISGGAEKQSIYLAHALGKSFSTQLVVYYGSKRDSKLISLAQSLKVSIVYLRGGHLSKFIQLYKLFSSHKPAFIFSYLATTNFLNAVIGGMSGAELRIGGIRSSVLKKSKLVIQRILHNRLLHYSVFNNYSGLTNLSKQGFNPDKCVVIHNAIEVNKTQILRKPSSTIKLLSVGRFVQAKNFEMALILIKELLNLIPPYLRIEYYLVGYGPLESKLRNHVQLLSLEETVTFAINPENITTYYQNADIFLQTSVREGMPNAVMEAMSYSLPVVATDVGDTRYLVEEGVTGFICELGNTKLLVSSLLKLISSHELRLKLGSNGFQKITNSFSVEHMAKKYIDIFQLNNS